MASHNPIKLSQKPEDIAFNNNIKAKIQAAYERQAMALSYECFESATEEEDLMNTLQEQLILSQ